MAEVATPAMMKEVLCEATVNKIELHKSESKNEKPIHHIYHPAGDSGFQWM